MSLENIMLRKRGKAQKAIYIYTIPVTRNVQNTTTHRHRKYSSCLRLGRRGWGRTVNGNVFLIEVMKAFWNWVVISVVQFYEYTGSK